MTSSGRVHALADLDRGVGSPAIRAAISTAQAWFSTSTTQNPTSDARDSANGPSLATGHLLDPDRPGNRVGEPLLEHQLAELGQLNIDPLHELDHLFDPLGRLALEPGRAQTS